MKTRGNEAFRSSRTEESLGVYRDAIAQFPFALPPAAESASDARAVKRPGPVALAGELAVLYANCAACLLQLVNLKLRVILLKMYSRNSGSVWNFTVLFDLM